MRFFLRCFLALALGQPLAALAQPRDARAPVEERSFIELVEDFARQYRAAPNQMVAGGLRPTRARAICTALKASRGQVRNWVGEVTKLDSTATGYGVLTVRISRGIQLATWTVEFADTADKTLLPPNSPLFRIASRLRTGQIISFDGLFRPHRDDCIRELSLTVDGAMRDPDFLFRFTAIRPLD